MLCLLAQTYEPWTSIQTSQENLSAGPVNGDLIDLNEDFHVTLEDEIIGVLCLLAQTYEPWTSIQISQENLSAWPVNGDLIDLNEDFHVTLEDEIIEDTTNPQPMITQF